jgi:hypothetical protein
MAYKVSDTEVITPARALTNVSIGPGVTGLPSGFPTVQVYTSPATWTKPANLVGVKVTVIGGGGALGSPTVNPGSTSSFGPLASATGGSSQTVPSGTSYLLPAADGVGSGGTINISGSILASMGLNNPASPAGFREGNLYGGGATVSVVTTTIPDVSPDQTPVPVTTFTVGHAGNGGTAIRYIPAPTIPGPVSVTVGAGGTVSGPAPSAPLRRAGAAGIVIVEEFY